MTCPLSSASVSAARKTSSNPTTSPPSKRALVWENVPLPDDPIIIKLFRVE